MGELYIAFMKLEWKWWFVCAWIECKSWSIIINSSGIFHYFVCLTRFLDAKKMNIGAQSLAAVKNNGTLLKVDLSSFKLWLSSLQTTTREKCTKNNNNKWNPCSHLIFFINFVQFLCLTVYNVENIFLSVCNEYNYILYIAIII